MNLTDPLSPIPQPSTPEDETQTITRAEQHLTEKGANEFLHSTRVERAEMRTEEAEIRTDQANTRTQQAEARTQEANRRTELAEIRTKQAEARTDEAMEKAAIGIEKKRILAVDDQASNTRLIKTFLERTHEYVVREENNSLSALSAAEAFRPDLILLDVMMPGRDGGDLAACFKRSAQLKDVPIVFLTASVTKAEVQAGGGRIGGQFFLAKPLVLTEMAACVKLHLRG